MVKLRIGAFQQLRSDGAMLVARGLSAPEGWRPAGSGRLLRGRTRLTFVPMLRAPTYTPGASFFAISG